MRRYVRASDDRATDLSGQDLVVVVHGDRLPLTLDPCYGTGIADALVVAQHADPSGVPCFVEALPLVFVPSGARFYALADGRWRLHEVRA